MQRKDFSLRILRRPRLQLKPTSHVAQSECLNATAHTPLMLCALAFDPKFALISVFSGLLSCSGSTHGCDPSAVTIVAGPNSQEFSEIRGGRCCVCALCCLVNELVLRIRIWELDRPSNTYRPQPACPHDLTKHLILAIHCNTVIFWRFLSS